MRRHLTPMDEPRDPAAKRELLLPAVRRLGDLPVEPIGREEFRTALGRAALEVVGEVGHERLTVERILVRGGASRSAFYRVFANADDCYLRGYEEVGGRVVDGLLDRCGDAPDWRSGVRTALDALAAAISGRPLMAAGLILQVRSGSAAADDARGAAEVRLAAAIDRGRDVAPAGLTPPPNAGAFIFGAIEAAAVQALAHREPQEFFERVPDLTFLAVATYLGVDAARDPAGG